jgi:beta-glucosidase
MPVDIEDPRRAAARPDALEHKLGQMIQAERASTTPDDVARYHLGSVSAVAAPCPAANRVADWVAMHDAYWMASVRDEPGRVPMPLLYAIDAIHGNANVLGATVLPHNIGLGAARDPELVERLARVCAERSARHRPRLDLRADAGRGAQHQVGPHLRELLEDPAWWPRTPRTTCVACRGRWTMNGVIACAKHWIGDGGTTGGVDQGDTQVSEEELLRTHAAPYLPALEAGVLTVMASFNSWNKEKCHASRYLLTDVLKGRFGFDGFVMSDWDGVDQMDDDLATALATGHQRRRGHGHGGHRLEEMLDTLRRVVETAASRCRASTTRCGASCAVKARAGLFERGRPAERPWAGSASFGGAEHREIAREAVRKSLVLLKHEGACCPWREGARVLVAGKNAHDRGHQCGGFTVEWQGTRGNDRIEGGTSIWEGIQAVAPQAELSVDGSAADASKHDVAIVVIGETPYAEGMGDIREGGAVPRGSGMQTMTNLAPYGRTLVLAERHPEDLATIQRIRAQGIPVVTVLVSGRPLVTNAELAASDAFVAAWLPGSEGAGVADVLFGDHDFQGSCRSLGRHGRRRVWQGGGGLPAVMGGIRISAAATKARREP